MQLSVLDLSPVSAGSSAAQALHNTLDLARFVDGLGFTRYWLAEHHNTPLIASAVPEVMIGHVAGVTARMRVGSGGVMLPNHVPLKVAETFRTLEALHPGRIDLGIGRAPGTDQLTAIALRRSMAALNADDFPERMAELLAFLSDEFPPDHPFQRIQAIPAGVPAPEIWLLGSSDFSARLAAELGLAFAFAHHISPEPAVAALRFYRERFRPSSWLAEPRAMLTVSAVCASTDEEADELARSSDLAILRLYAGHLEPLRSVEDATAYPYTPEERDWVRGKRARIFVGSPATVRERLTRLATEAGVDEVMVTTMTYEHALRKRSYALLAEAFGISQPSGVT
jgi:luciferase family oxidoreductase group 1